MPPPNQVDPFSVEAITQNGIAFLPHFETWDGFHLNKPLESEFLHLNEAQTESLPDLKSDVFHLSLEDVPLPGLSNASSASTSDSENDYFESFDGSSVEDDAVDIWILPDISKRRTKSQLCSWDRFLDKHHDEPTSAYLSEATPTVLQSTLETADHGPPLHVKSDVLLHAFAELCLGRASILFKYEENDRTFVPQWQNITAYGYSPILILDYFVKLTDVGASVRNLRRTFQVLDEFSVELSPARVGLLSTLRSILHAIEAYQSVNRLGLMSLLQLKVEATNIAVIIDMLEQLKVTQEKERTDETLIRGLIQEASRVSIHHHGLGEILQCVIRRACQPSLAILSEQIGLCSIRCQGLLRPSPETSSPEDTACGTLLGSDLASTVQRTRQSLRLLKKYSPECSLLSTTTLSSSPLKLLEIGFGFEDVCELQSRAVAYEDAMKSLLVSAASSTSTTPLETPTSASFSLDEPITLQVAPVNPFRLDLNSLGHGIDALEEIKDESLHGQVIAYLEGQHTEEPRLSLDLEEILGLSLGPLVSAQHRLISYSVLRLLFQDHNLVGHLNLQRGFHLFGNASFSSRLCIALFDSDQTSGEGLRRNGASTGLRLQARDTWPPAGSELRLVLMSILSDSFSPAERRLDDSISFAIRDMPAEELEKCRDVNSIHALDFLRLQYAAPNELLEAVITPEVLSKYDRISQHLLRTMRAQAVTQTLLLNGCSRGTTVRRAHSEHKMILEMHNFITSIADYCHNTAIGVHWSNFHAKMCTAKGHIDNQDYDQTLLTVRSLDHLRGVHESTLDSILHALLLKRKQTVLRQILEDVYELILQFDAQQRQEFNNESVVDDVGRIDDNAPVSTALKRVHEDFRSKVLQFIDGLRSQHQSPKVPGDETEDVDLFEYLLLRLDMSGYWSRRKGIVRGAGHVHLDLI